MKLPTAVALLLILVAGACAPELTERKATAATHSDTVARPYRAEEPENAILAPIDPVRERVTAQLRNGFRDRITDLTYLSAIGQLAQTEPAWLPLYIAHRENHNDCLRATRQDAAEITGFETSATGLRDNPQSELRDELFACLRQKTDDWAGAAVETRSQWLRPILDAAARAHNPARHYGTLHPNPESSPTFVEMSQVYAQCEDLAAPRADLAAISDRPVKATQQLEQAVQDISHCIAAATRLAWPDPVR